MEPKHSPDMKLHFDICELASKEQQTAIEVLCHLKEVQKRNLHKALGHESLFDYLRKELNYCGHAAGWKVHLLNRLGSTLEELGRKSSPQNTNNRPRPQQTKGHCADCGGMRFLSYEFIKPLPKDGDLKLEGIRLLCFSCSRKRVATAIRKIQPEQKAS